MTQFPDDQASNLVRSEPAVRPAGRQREMTPRNISTAETKIPIEARMNRTNSVQKRIDGRSSLVLAPKLLRISPVRYPFHAKAAQPALKLIRINAP